MPREKGLFSFRSFPLALIGQFTSTIGDYCYAIALPWLVLNHHGSPALLGGIVACYGVPRTALIPLGGLLADRLGPRRLLIGTCLVRGVATAGMALLATHATLIVPILIVLAIVLGSGEGLFLPGSYALIPSLVTTEQLQPANSMYEIGLQLGAIIGPAIGGVLVAVAGPWPAFAVDAASFGIAGCALIAMPRKPHPTEHTVGQPAGGPGILAYLRTQRALQVSLMLIVVANLGFAGIGEVALPTLAHAHFGASGFGSALVTEAIGALMGAMLAMRFVRLRRPAITVSMTDICASVSIALLPLTLTLINAMISMCALGLFTSFSNIVFLSVLQQVVPKQLVGRLMGLVMLAAFGVAPLATFLTGVAISRFGPVPMFPVAGLMLTIAVSIGLTQRSYRDLGMTTNEGSPSG